MTTFACIFCGLRGHDPEKMEHHLFVEHHHRVGLDPTPSREELHRHLDEEHDEDDWNRCVRCHDRGWTWTQGHRYESCSHEERILVCNRCGEYRGDEPA